MSTSTKLSKDLNVIGLYSLHQTNHLGGKISCDNCNNMKTNDKITIRPLPFNSQHMSPTAANDGVIPTKEQCHDKYQQPNADKHPDAPSDFL